LKRFVIGLDIDGVIVDLGTAMLPLLSEVCARPVAYQNGREANTSLGNYFRFYNTERPHQAHGYRTPAEVYASTPVESTSRGMVESLTPDPFRVAGPNLTMGSTSNTGSGILYGGMPVVASREGLGIIKISC